jgi:hypothetical protein
MVAVAVASLLSGSDDAADSNDGIGGILICIPV